MGFDGVEFLSMKAVGLDHKSLSGKQAEPKI
jgi:hypothetical protein